MARRGWAGVGGVIPYRPEGNFLQVSVQKAEEKGAWEYRAKDKTPSGG